MIQTTAFATIAACALLAAIFVVTSQRIVRAVLWLGVSLVATAGLYAIQGASFLAAVQALVYVGGIITLMIIGVMVTRRHDGIAAEIDSSRKGPAAIVAIALFGILAYAIETTPDLDAPGAPPPPVTTADLGRALLVDHVLAFEVVSFLLLGAIVGAIVIARRKDPDPEAVPYAPTTAAAPKEAE